METKNRVIIGPSQIHKCGLFAKKVIGPGELVVLWDKKELNQTEFERLTPEEKDYIDIQGEKIFLMGEPARYVNHSCSPNTIPGKNGDISLRQINIGEEITTDYASFYIPSGQFQCSCSSPNCRGIIFGKYK